jgi:hypothetical protein
MEKPCILIGAGLLVWLSVPIQADRLASQNLPESSSVKSLRDFSLSSAAWTCPKVAFES